LDVPGAPNLNAEKHRDKLLVVSDTIDQRPKQRNNISNVPNDPTKYDGSSRHGIQQLNSALLTNPRQSEYQNQHSAW